MDRPDISRLNKNRSIYLKLGFIIALGFTVMAFNYTVHDTLNRDYKPQNQALQDDLWEEVQRTVHKEKKMPPPPVLEPTEKFVEEDVIFDPEPEPEPVKEPVEVTTPKIEPVAIAATPAPRPPAPKVEPEPIIDEAPPIFVAVEEMPRFPGCNALAMDEKELKKCSDKAMLDFIYSEVRYPALARENGIEGTVVVSFVIEKDGAITGLKILREIGGGCGNEVKRIVKKMPKWVPGKQQGRSVRVQFNLPVKFTLQR